jgi:HAMP domain-containing protein
MAAEHPRPAQIPGANADSRNMKQVILLAIVVFAAFCGLVVMRETGRRTDSAGRSTAEVFSSKARKATISTGEAVEIEDHLAPDKWTVVQFTADW